MIDMLNTNNTVRKTWLSCFCFFLYGTAKFCHVLIGWSAWVTGSWNILYHLPETLYNKMMNRQQMVIPLSETTESSQACQWLLISTHPLKGHQIRRREYLRDGPHGGLPVGGGGGGVHFCSCFWLTTSPIEQHVARQFICHNSCNSFIAL